MRGIESGDGGWLRHVLGQLTAAAIRKLSTIARRLGTPALATVPVSAAILTRLPVVNAELSLEDVAELFVGGRNVELAVVEDGQPIGVVTRDDIVLGLERHGPRAPLADAPRHDVVTVTPSDSLADVLDQLRKTPDRIALVVDRGVPVGLLTLDRLAAYARVVA